MSDEIKNDPVVTGAQGQMESPENASIDNDEFKKLAEMNKKLQSNFDRVNTDLQKTMKELETRKKETMTQQQLKELEKQEYETKLVQKEKELTEKTIAFEKTQEMVNQKIDLEILNISTDIASMDVDVFKEGLKKYNEAFKKAVEKAVNEKLALANPIPGKGQKPNDDIWTLEEIRDLSKKNGTQWTVDNMSKIDKSYAYWNKK